MERETEEWAERVGEWGGYRGAVETWEVVPKRGWRQETHKNQNNTNTDIPIHPTFQSPSQPLHSTLAAHEAPRAVLQQYSY